MCTNPIWHDEASPDVLRLQKEAQTCQNARKNDAAASTVIKTALATAAPATKPKPAAKNNIISPAATKPKPPRTWPSTFSGDRYILSSPSFSGTRTGELV